MSTLLLSDRDVAALLPMSECIDVMAGVLKSMAEGACQLPLRTVIRLPNSPNAFATMPAVVNNSAGGVGAKIITVFPGNDATPFDSHIGVVLLFDDQNGSLLAIADASSITAIRTAAVSGVATRALAREDASTLAILGATALPHLDAVCAVRPIKSVRVWSRSGTRAHEFANHVRNERDVTIDVCETVRDTVRDADVVCTITSSRTPVLEGEWLSPGTHINAVGASLPTARELDTAAVKMSRLYVDRRESAQNEAGDFLLPRAEGVIDDSHIVGELGELLTGAIVGRTSDSDVTLFKSLGLAIEDVAAVRHIYEKARRTNMGTRFALGGLRAHS